MAVGRGHPSDCPRRGYQAPIYLPTQLGSPSFGGESNAGKTIIARIGDRVQRAPPPNDLGATVQITARQMATLQESAYADFDQRMCEHLATFNPQLARAAGEARLKAAVQSARRRANEHGFTRVHAIQLFLELALLLGHRFDSDPLLPWVSHLLRDAPETGESTRAQRLYNYAMRYFDMVEGTRQAQLKDALRTALQWTATPSAPTVEDLLRLHPAKARMVGPEPLADALARAREQVSKAGMAGWATLPLAAMMLFCGSAVADDPLYPWLADALRLDERRDAEAAAQRLLDRIRLYGQHALAHLEQE